MRTLGCFIILFLFQVGYADEYAGYIGCFEDGIDRVLPHLFVRENNTIDGCISICRDKGYEYAGLEYGRECFCGDTPQRYRIVGEEKCDIPCSGQQSQKCGGNWMISLYKTTMDEILPPQPEQSLGCFVDKSDRILPFITFDISNTPGRCIDTCKRRKMKFAGVEYGFCGNEMREYPSRPDNECDKHCPGDTTQTCGGSWRIQIFKTDEITPGSYRCTFEPNDPCFVEGLFTTVQALSKTNLTKAYEGSYFAAFYDLDYLWFNSSAINLIQGQTYCLEFYYTIVSDETSFDIYKDEHSWNNRSNPDIRIGTKVGWTSTTFSFTYGTRGYPMVELFCMVESCFGGIDNASLTQGSC